MKKLEEQVSKDYLNMINFAYKAFYKNKDNGKILYLFMKPIKEEI